jgi:tetratricopeptide (TPR) repeat protein
MKVVFIILFLNLFSLSCFAQVDSLSFFLNSTKVDSIKSYDLLKYAYRLDLNEENDRAINALSKCSELAIKENQTKLFIKSEKLKAFILIRTNRYDDAIKVANRLLAYSVKNKSSFGKAHSIRLLGIIETNKGNLDGSLKKHFEAQKLWEDTKDSSLIIEGLADIGTVFFYQKDYRSAIKYWKKN